MARKKLKSEKNDAFEGEEIFRRQTGKLKVVKGKIKRVVCSK